MRKDNGKTMLRVSRSIASVIGIMAIIVACFQLYISFKEGEGKLEHELKKGMGSDEDIISVQIIDDDRGVGFVGYNCTSKKVMKGIKECRGEYMIFANKTLMSWVFDNNSKVIL